MKSAPTSCGIRAPVVSVIPESALPLPSPGIRSHLGSSHFGSSRVQALGLSFRCICHPGNPIKTRFESGFCLLCTSHGPCCLPSYYQSSVENLVVLDLVRSLWWNMGIQLGRNQPHAVLVGKHSRGRTSLSQTSHLPKVRGKRENGTSAGVLALVHSRWFSKPSSLCTDEAEVLCPNPRLAGRVIRVMGTEILLLTAYFEHSVGFRSDINANLMQDVCFLKRDGKQPFILGADFNFPPSLWQDVSTHGGNLWLRNLEHQWLSQWTPHTRAVQVQVKSLTSSTISWCQHSSDH